MCWLFLLMFCCYFSEWIKVFVVYSNTGNYLPMMSHYCDVLMDMMASQITSLTIVYSTVYSGTDQRKHQSYASLAFVWGIHRSPVNSPHKWPVTRKMFPFDDVIMCNCQELQWCQTRFMMSKITSNLTCLFNSMFRGTLKKTSKPALLTLCEGNPSVTGGFPSQRANYAESISISWYHHGEYTANNYSTVLL